MFFILSSDVYIFVIVCLVLVVGGLFFWVGSCVVFGVGNVVWFIFLFGVSGMCGSIRMRFGCM